MARKHLKAGALTAPLPPVLVTVGEGERANIITIGWTGILSTIPPRTYISVRPERHSHGLLLERGEFVIHLTTTDMARQVDYCGIYTGAKVDKFSVCGFTRTGSKEVGVPTIAECPLALECRVVEVVSMGTHDVFVADIVSVSCDEKMLDSEGKLRYDSVGLLAYAHGEYFALGERVGKFGFSTDKKKGATQGGKRSAQSGSANKASADKRTAEKPSGKSSPATDKGRSADGAGNKEGAYRPFYLDAPRGKGRKKK